MTLPEAVSIDDLLPQQTEIGNWHTVPIGLSADGSPATINFTSHPGIFVGGSSPVARADVLTTLGLAALASGHQLAIVDCSPARELGVFHDIAAIEDSQPLAALAMIRLEIYRRRRTLGSQNWKDLDPNRMRCQGFSPMTVLVNGMLGNQGRLTKSLRHVHEQLTMASDLEEIAREGQEVGVFLAVAGWWGDYQALGEMVAGQLSARILNCLPGTPIHDAEIAYALDVSAEMFPADLRDLAAANRALGFALLAPPPSPEAPLSSAAHVQPVRIALAAHDETSRLIDRYKISAG